MNLWGEMAGVWQDDELKKRERNNFRDKSKQKFNNTNRYQSRGKDEKQFSKSVNITQNYNQKLTPNKFSCEICTRDFNNQTKLNKHISEHETCPANNCNFKAHTKLVEIHFNNVHKIKTRLHPNIESCWNIDTPEDVEKWRAERRKRFPTIDKTVKAGKVREEKVRKFNEKNDRKRKFEGDKRGGNDFKQSKSFDGKFKNKSVKFKQQPKVDRELNDTPQVQQLWPPKKQFTNYSTSDNLDKSLLSKLLSNEINREATILMQCIHHTVENKFYNEPEIDPETVPLDESSESQSDTSSEYSSSTGKSSLEMDFYDDGEDDDDLLDILNSYLN